MNSAGKTKLKISIFLKILIKSLNIHIAVKPATDVLKGREKKTALRERKPFGLSCANGFFPERFTDMPNTQSDSTTHTHTLICLFPILEYGARCGAPQRHPS